jgi:hypothetical protein
MSSAASKQILPGCSVLPPITGTTGPGGTEAIVTKERSRRGRFEEINAFVDFTIRGLNRTEIAVWLMLWRDTKPDGIAKTSQSDLARRAGATERTVRRAIRRLTALGLLRVVHAGGLRRGPSHYRVCLNPTGSMSEKE